jgi:integrase
VHDLPLSPEDRRRVLRAAQSQPPRERLLAGLVFGHGLALADALAIKVEDIAWGDDHARLAVQADTGDRRTVTIEREELDAVLGDRRQGALLATASGIPIRPDYAARALLRVGEAAGVPSKLSARRLRFKRSAVAR